MATTRQILEQHINAFLAYDLQGVLADYDQDILFFTANGTLNGVGAIRPVFETLIEEFRGPGSSFTLGQCRAEGDYGYITWKAETSANVYELATDTFVVRNGKIVAQSFTAWTTPKC